MTKCTVAAVLCLGLGTVEGLSINLSASKTSDTSRLSWRDRLHLKLVSSGSKGDDFDHPEPAFRNDVELFVRNSKGYSYCR